MPNCLEILVATAIQAPGEAGGSVVAGRREQPA